MNLVQCDGIQIAEEHRFLIASKGSSLSRILSICELGEEDLTSHEVNHEKGRERNTKKDDSTENDKAMALQRESRRTSARLVQQLITKNGGKEMKMGKKETLKVPISLQKIPFLF